MLQKPYQGPRTLFKKKAVTDILHEIKSKASGECPELITLSTVQRLLLLLSFAKIDITLSNTLQLGELGLQLTDLIMIIPSFLTRLLLQLVVLGILLVDDVAQVGDFAGQLILRLLQLLDTVLKLLILLVQSL